jgi:tRNA nucleotidyltransferase (CCA-adding enzyme)
MAILPAPEPYRDGNARLHAPAGIPSGGEFVIDPKAEAITSRPLTAQNDAARSPAPDLIELTPAALSVIAAIRGAGGRPLIVGGSVRDALLAESSGIPIAFKDIDLEVYGVDSHDVLIDALRGLGRVDEQGASFGVVAAHVDGQDFDVSLPRRDSKTGDGHTGFTVQVDANIDEADAFARRDFTINAMGWDPETHELVDHFGGRDDLAAGILRHTSDAFSEDSLRVLRGAQFAARFGFEFAPETTALAQAMADRFPELSTERVWGEWRKIATRGLHVTAALRALEATNWLQHFPQLAATRGIQQDAIWHSEGDVFTHVGLAADEAAKAADCAGLSSADREIAVLGALVHDFGKVTHTQTSNTGRITSHGHAEAGVEPAARFLTGIGAPAHLQAKVLPLVAEHMCHVSTETIPSATAVRRLIRRLNGTGDGPTIYDWARVVDADSAGRGASAKASPSAAWLARATEVGPTAAKGILTGKHLIDAGWKPGPQFKAVLAAAVEAQDAGEIVDEVSAVKWFGLHGDRIRGE